MIRNRGITFKLIFFILTSCTIIFAVIFGYNYLFSRRIIIGKIEENARNLALRTVNRIDTVLCSVQKVPGNLAYSLEQSSYTKEGLLNLLRSVVENNPELYGSTISFEPYSFEKGAFYFAPYYYKSEGKLKFTYLKDDYNYFEWDWYKLPQKLGKPVWTEPFYDEGGGNIIMSTYTVPFYKDVEGKREFAGVVTADVYLSRLQDIVSSIKIGETGYGFLISREGTIVTHPKKELIMKEKLSTIAEAQQDNQLIEIIREMTKGNSGFAPSTSIVTGRKCWIGYEPIPSTGWSLGIVFPQDELMADVTNLSKYVLMLGLLGILILLVVIVLISGSITRPLRALARSTKDIAEGNLDFKLPPIKSKDEVGRLAGSFIYMKDSLKEYIKELTETTAVKERMESELKIACDIQMEMLPKVFPPFPERNEFTIHAVLEPAREVGGDLYDFFFIDDDRLCFIIGDVSGKGVPAALFMAMTITLIKAVAKEIKSPDEILSRVNIELSNNNDSSMFVTLFCGILNIQTGEVCYSNAGHNPPLIIRNEKEAEFLSGAASTILGIYEDTVYKKEKIILRPGDTIYMYTDGVTEAFNKEGEMFSEERLQREVFAHRKESVDELARKTLQHVKAYSTGIPQSDDITILVLRYLRDKAQNEPTKENKSIVLKNDPSEI